MNMTKNEEIKALLNEWIERKRDLGHWLASTEHLPGCTEEYYMRNSIITKAIEDLRKLSDDWIKVTERLPDEGQIVSIGHSLGNWVYPEVRFMITIDEETEEITHHFVLRVNGGLGGDAGFKQIDRRKGPKDWLLGGEVMPTHWMPKPNAPT